MASPSEPDLSAYAGSGISNRAMNTLRNYPKFFRYFDLSKEDEYDPETNPNGIVPFGMAENKIAMNLFLPKLQEIEQQRNNKRVYTYSPTTGYQDLKVTMKRFLEHTFRLQKPLDITKLFITDCVTTNLENFAFALAESGDYILVFRPFYYRLVVDLYERAGVRILPVSQHPPSEATNFRFSPDIAALETAMSQAKTKGKVVRAIHINNPANPTGETLTAQELTELLSFAHRHDLHVIANELYGLSIFDPEVTFTSLLHLPHPDPTKVHFMYGFSKDFGLSGLKVAVVYTQNPGVMQFFTQTGIYIEASGTVQERLKVLLDDLDYIDSTLAEIKKLVRARHLGVKDAIEGCGGRVHASPATVFRWLDLTSFMESQDWEAENRLFHRLWSAGVHLVAGASLGHSQPGWFRMVAAVEEPVHQEGMRRLVKILKTIRAEREGAQRD